ncbi:MAG: hypothetical protein Q9226_005634 [Calogaya cf. arnoldii]
MVKADPKCDYYADLELPPSAEATEIKRQFKKLALKYHPDRNPGKELEFNSKFQAIQAAHEVLTDPAQRARYDADRRKNGMLHTYSSPLRPNPPPRAAASNFPPPPQRTGGGPSRTGFAPQSAGGTSRYSAYMRADPNNSYKSPPDDAKARANAFKAWEQMRHGQGVPPQARPVPPRPTKNSTFQPAREAGSFPPQEAPQRPPWDQTKEPHAGFPKMARSNTTRGPKKGGFSPGFSVGDEPPPRNTSAYFNVPKGEKPDASRSNFESRPVPPPPPPASSNQRSSLKRPDPLKPFRPQSATDDNLANNERLSTPYATSGGEKTYFSTSFSRPTSAREGTSAGDVYDSEPLNRSPNPKSASAASHRGHHSASPKMRGPRPVSISSTSSSSTDESLREGVEELYTSAGKSRGNQHRPQNGHLKPSYRPYSGFDDAGGDKRIPPRSRSDVAGSTSASGQHPPSADSKVDPGQAEGFMEHRMKHEAERTHGMQEFTSSGRHASDSSRPQQRPLNRPKSWHEKYGAAEQDQARNNLGRPATGGQPDKPSMYDTSGFGPSSLTPSSQNWYQQWPFGGSRTSSTARYHDAPIPNWAIPSCIPPLRRSSTQQSSHPQLPSTSPTVENANNTAFDSFTFPPESKALPSHPPPLRSHSSDTISVSFSPSDWHGKFTGKPEEYFDPTTRKNNNASRGRSSPTKRQAPTINQVQPTPPVEGSEVPNGGPQMPPPPLPQASSQDGKYSPDKWAPYFKPGTLNWTPPPPPAGAPPRAASRKRPITPSRRVSKTTFKRPAVPKPANVAPAVDVAEDDANQATPSTLGSGSSQDSGNGTPMDLDTGNSPPHGADASNHTDARNTTSHPPIPPRATVPPRKPTPQDSHLGLGDLKNVAPFAPNQEGVNDLRDLNTTLPFESKASAQPTKPPSPQKLALPQPPKPPTAPPVLTQSSWEHYIAAMRSYMTGWNLYNAQMLAHFNERQASFESVSAAEWISAVGAGTEKWGYGKYMQGVEEDFRVRAHWDVSWEKHRECMRALGAVRERLLGVSLRAGD